ncbi:hypothetical protein KK062_27620, partial [Fulvivirgaceae bacterium PWU5]
MNFIHHFRGWMDRSYFDGRLKTQHTSLYNVLFHLWNLNRFQNPVIIDRKEVMQWSKIGSINTYIRTLKDLTEWGYILYEPSFNPQQGSKVHLYRFDKGADKGTDKAGGRGPDIGADKGRDTIYINNTNSLNTKNKINAYGTSNENSDFGNARENQDTDPQATGTGIDHREKQTPGGRGPGAGFDVPASVEEAKDYFIQENSTAAEAQKFVNHYQSNGWLIGGRSPMKDWRASARNWIDNAKKFAHDKSSQPKPGKLDTGPKNYAEPRKPPPAQRAPGRGNA